MYRTTLTRYNRTLRKAKRDYWRRSCEGIESTQQCARLQRILKKDSQTVINSLRNDLGELTTFGEETIKELLRVHFSGSEIIELPENLETVGVKQLRIATREHWQVSKKVIEYDKLRWAINSFDPFKSPGPRGIYPVLLQKGYRTSDCVAYIGQVWP